MEGFIKATLGKRFFAFVIDFILFCGFIQSNIVWLVILWLIDFNFKNVIGKPFVFLQGVIIGNSISFVVFSFKDIFMGVSLGKKSLRLLYETKTILTNFLV